MSLDPISREYVSLALGIDRLFSGYVDAYFGPPEVKEEALAGDPPEPAALLERARGLADQIVAGDYPDQRKGYLTVQVRAMILTCRKLAGESVPYLEEVRESFDVAPGRTPESRFDEAIAELDDLLPGEGDVAARMIAWRKDYEIPVETARSLIDLIAGETRRRTQAFVDLPAGEQIDFAFVSNQPWSGYNWYLGGNRSRVDVNTDLPIRANDLVPLIAHEAYPGHHTEHALKDQLLYRERGYGEHAIQVINTPECVISEGIATLAESIIFPGDELARFRSEQVYPAAGLSGDPEREAAIARAQRVQRAVAANAAMLLHHDGASDEVVVAYLMRYGLRSEPEARQSLRFISDPLWRPYIFTYSVGRDLLGQWLDLAPEGERRARFRTLLTEQIYPSQIQGWIDDNGL